MLLIQSQTFDGAICNRTYEYLNCQQWGSVKSASLRSLLYIRMQLWQLQEDVFALQKCLNSSPFTCPKHYLVYSVCFNMNKCIRLWTVVLNCCNYFATLYVKGIGTHLCIQIRVNCFHFIEQLFCIAELYLALYIRFKTLAGYFFQSLFSFKSIGPYFFPLLVGFLVTTF